MLQEFRNDRRQLNNVTLFINNNKLFFCKLENYYMDIFKLTLFHSEFVPFTHRIYCCCRL